MTGTALRTSLRRRVLAGAVLTLIAAVAVVALLPRDPVLAPQLPTSAHDPSAHDHGALVGSGSSGARQLGPAPVPDDPGVALDVADAPASALGSAGETSLAAAAGAPVAARDIASLGPSRTDIDPEQVLVGESETLGGCKQEYGLAGQCLPVIPPSESAHVQQMIDAGLDPATMTHRWTCAELTQYFPSGIAVRSAGVDPDELDHDDDGVACGESD